MIHKLRKKIKKRNLIFQNPPRENTIFLTDPAFSNSKVKLPTLRPSAEPALHRDDSSTFQLSTGKFQFKPQVISLSKFSTPYKFLLIPNCYIDHYSSYASKYLAPYEY